MPAEVARNYRVEVGTALSAALNVTGVSKANGAVVSGTGFSAAAGDWVMFGEVVGMPELSYLVARVAASPAPTATAFTLEGVDSTNWGTYVSGACQRITTWSLLSLSTSVDFGAGSADDLDATTLYDVTKQSLPGLITLPPVQINLFTDYAQTVQTAIETNAMNATITPFRTTKNSGHRRAWAGVPSLIGESVNSNQVIGGSLNVVVRSTRYVKYTT